MLTAEFPAFYVVNCYVPNSGDGLKRLDYRINNWDKGGCRWESKATPLLFGNVVARPSTPQTFLPT